MFSCLRPVLCLLLPMQFAAGHPMDETFVWGNQTVAVDSSINPLYGALESDITLTGSRYPFVVYATKTPATLRSVKWRGGQKLDELVLTAPGEITALQLKSHGGEVAMVHEVLTYQETFFGYIYHLSYSRLTAAGWSTPEIIDTSSSSHSFDLELAPDGSACVALDVRQETGSPSGDEVRYYRRGSSGWSYQVVRPVVDYRSVSSVKLALMPDGEPHIAYIEYSSLSGGPSNRTQHASRSNAVWSSATVLQGNLGALDCGGDGILRIAGAGAYREFRDGAWSPIEQPGDPYATGVRDSLAAAADGTIYLLVLQELRVRKDGEWNTYPIPVLQKVIVDDNGIPHLLGTKEQLVRHHTRIPSAWQHWDVVPEGSPDSRLLGLVAAGNNDPRMYVYQFGGGGNREFSLQNGTWLGQPLNNPVVQVEYAMQPGGPLHGLSGNSYWRGTRSSLVAEPIPVSSSASSSSHIYSLFLDPAGNPHVSFPAYQSGSGYSVYYATKQNNTWQTSEVGPAPYSQHSAVALDSHGVAHVLTSNGLYKKQGNTWQQEIPLDDVTFTCLVGTADGNLHGLYLSHNIRLFTFSGKDGNYSTQLLDEKVSFRVRPSLTLAAGRPVAAYVSSLGASYSYMLNFAERTGNYWRQETVVPISLDQDYGDQVRITADPSGQIYLAAPHAYVVDHLIKNRITLYKRSVHTVASPALPPSVAAVKGAPREFHLPLPLAPASFEFQTSPDLVTWTTRLDFSALPSLPEPGPSIEIPGDGFRNGLIYRAPGDARATFVRIVEK